MDQPMIRYSFPTGRFQRFQRILIQNFILSLNQIVKKKKNIASREILWAQDKACYEVRNLELGCQYFLQVQAVAVYGGRRLASRKASKVFNSTDYEKYGRDWSL